MLSFGNLFSDTHSVLHVEVRVEVQRISPPKFLASLMIEGRELDDRVVVVPLHGYLYQSDDEQVRRCQSKISVGHHSDELHYFADEALRYLFLLHSLL